MKANQFLTTTLLLATGLGLNASFNAPGAQAFSFNSRSIM